MGFLLMAKMIAARTRIWGFHGHYMGLNLGLLWQTGAYICADFGHGNRTVFWGLFWLKRGILGTDFYDRDGNSRRWDGFTGMDGPRDRDSTDVLSSEPDGFTLPHVIDMMLLESFVGWLGS
jgi:hypothetical protein